MITRVISALVAAAVIIAAALIWKTPGLYTIGCIVVLGCIYEYAKLTFAKAKAPPQLRIAFMVLASAIFGGALIQMELAAGIASIAAILFLTMGILTVSKISDLGLTLKFQSAGLVGFFYCGLFPAMALGTLGFDEGPVWFFGLLAIVFAGDTFAYLFGRMFGSRKLLEAVSPKKTIEGSFGGLFGSALAGAGLCHFFLADFPIYQFVLIGVVSGAFAQVGDLFESLLKRIAEVKDSGAIMPGHGGFLDRIDGVLFAAPIYYVLVRFLVA